jgi:hypothetical protein
LASSPPAPTSAAPKPKAPAPAAVVVPEVVEAPNANALAASAQASLDVALAPEKAPRSATPAFEAEPVIYPPDAPNEREPVVPTLAEWLAAGHAEIGYCRRFGKNPTPNTPAAKADAKPALVHLPPSPDPNGLRRYKVWQHGELHRNGKVYRPGDTLELTEAVAAGITCVVLAE